MAAFRFDVHSQIDKCDELSIDQPGQGSRESILSWLSSTSTPPGASRKRKSALTESHHNIMLPRAGSPSKRRKRETVEETEDHGDLDATPRAGGYHPDVVPPLPTATRPTSSSASKSSRASRSAKSERSSSPTKKMVDMRLQPRPPMLKHFEDSAVPLPDGLAEMLSAVQRFSRGLGVIAESCKVGTGCDSTTVSS